MDNREEIDFKDERLKQIKLFIYLVPVIGLIPALWTLSRGESSTSAKRVSRISVNLAIAWLLAYTLLWLGANQSPELLSFRLLYLNSLLTSGYFIACFLMMFTVWRGKLPSFPQFPGLKQQKPPNTNPKRQL